MWFGFRKGRLDIATYAPRRVRWSLSDVARVVILFLFFAYVVMIIESFLIHLIPVFREDNFRMMVNSSVMDIIGAVFVVYFSVYKYKEKLIALGLTFKNLFRNIFYGIAGYIAGVPVFFAVVLIVFLVVKLIGYVPERQPVVELFLKEENPTFLIYSSIFASIFGPFIEELFFRAFMYNAAKKVMRAFLAAVVTSGVFAFLHTNVVGFFPIMVLGVLLTYMYEKTGSLVPSVTIHIVHNLAMVYFVFLVKGIGMA
jgi:membrane protease YdiL (CAAX protease family)